jgi:exopolysaccharide biosynthesis WecB/TagA/CpsF family protein
MTSHRRLEVLGVPFTPLTRRAAVDAAEELYERESPAWIAVENAHAMNLASSDPSHRDVLRRADMVLNDGKGMLLAARLLGDRFPEDLHGNTFTPALLERAADRGWPVFFMGAAPGVAEQAAEKLTAANPKLNIVGTHDGFIKGKEEAVLQSIRDAETGLLFVGMGMPLQEQWLDQNLAKTGARLASTVGAFYDFEAGVVPRAPSWMNKLGVEWVYRMLKEPKRLWRRYIIGNPLFVYRILRQRFRKR